MSNLTVVKNHAEDDLYRIGAVAKLTDISVERLRAWERRYALLPAKREGKTRFYSRAQVERLKKIQHLIDQGHAISTLVDLSDEHLDARLLSREEPAAKPATIGLIGPNVVMLEQSQNDTMRVNVASRWANLDAFADDDLSTTQRLDALVIQIPVLAPETIQFIEKKQPGVRLVLLYQFATETQIEASMRAGHPVLQWPAAWADIEQACANTAAAPIRAARAAPNRYSDEELIAIASSSDDPQGLPQHLVNLITQLNAFSEFAMDCADQAALEDGEAQGALYEQLHNDTSHARAQLELALESFVEAEQLTSRPR